ncbi:GIY-YIG nuclease family protein [Romboutsia timonensis]|uniref:hypothetical protein n=1 Tax=Romboutsia timonensis TaxID=1776391 RepID=UPI0008DAF95F|nr:hypothetical protein [Romboutsia timonensis]
MENKKLISAIIRNDGENSEYIKLISKANLKTVKYSDISTKIEVGVDLKNNNYEKIKDARGKVGIYIFYKEIEDENIEIIYVGECHTITKKDKEKNVSRWDLKERMKQHFIISDTGGMLYKISSGNKNEAITLRNELVDNAKLTYFFIEQNVQEILFLESYLIAMLKPKYNFVDKSKLESITEVI